MCGRCFVLILLSVSLYLQTAADQTTSCEQLHFHDREMQSIYGSGFKT